MKVIGISTFRDGGTKEIRTSDGTFWKDGRISSETRGKFYKGNYPGKDKSELLDDDHYEQQLIMALEQYENGHLNKLTPRTQAKDLYNKFFANGKLTTPQAKFAADLHLQLLIDLGVDSEYWKEVKTELANPKLLFPVENPEIDNVN